MSNSNYIGSGTVTPYSFVYDQPYFSGSQAAVYIGDVLVDEVTSISFQVSQEKTPIYGYASQYFDRVAPGPVMVQGSFTINFKEGGYLWAVLERWRGFTTGEITDVNEDIVIHGEEKKSVTAPGTVGSTRSTHDTKVETGTGTAYTSPSPFTRASEADRKLTGNLTRDSIEDLVNNKTSLTQRFSEIEELAAKIGNKAATGKDQGQEGQDITTVLNALETLVWNKRQGQPEEDFRRDSGGFQRPDDNRFDGFDIFVSFGDWENPRAPRTIKRLTNVHLVSQGLAVEITGAPVQEQYSFYARDLI